MPNSYASNPELNLSGQNMNDWQTGCSNVLLKLLIWHVFGVTPCMDGVRINPAAWSPFERARLRCKLHGCRVTVELSRGRVQRRRFRVDGVDWVDCEEHAQTKSIAAVVGCDRLNPTGETVIEVLDPMV
jgi:cellobiose phosphorylase